jgi:CCR4-NOT transcription complex subunit 1
MDGSVLQGRFPASLPNSLLPRQGQLSPAQQLVYEDFARIPRSATAALPGGGGAAAAPAAHPKPGSQVGSVDTAASLGSNAVAAMVGGVAAETPGGGGNLEEVLRALQDKYALWQQRLEALIAQVRSAFYCLLVHCWVPCAHAC